MVERGCLNLELNYEDVTEFDYQPGKCTRLYRVVAIRKNITKRRGERALLDEIRYFFYITTRTDLTAAEVVLCANDRCDEENVIEQLKNGVGALRVPIYDLVSNWAYQVPEPRAPSPEPRTPNPEPRTPSPPSPEAGEGQGHGTMGPSALPGTGMSALSREQDLGCGRLLAVHLAGFARRPRRGQPGF